MTDETSKGDWVKRVLGVDLPGEQRRPGAKLLPIWIEAKEAVDVGIGKLQDALRNSQDDDLQQIAEFGLYGATEGESVRLMAALRDADSSGGEAVQQVIAAVHDYQDFLDGAPIVDLIEHNPFGVSVPLRKTLGAALAELERLATA